MRCCAALALVLLGCGCSSSVATREASPASPRRPPQSSWHTLKNGASYDEPIEKPLQWAADNLYDSHGVDIDEATIRTQMLYNVDDRGPHLLVWSRNRMGMAGGVYLAFRHDGTAWRYMGSFGAGPYKVLTSAKDGSLRIATYWRAPPGAGVLAVLTHNGATFVPVSSMFIQGDDDGLEEPGEARFNEVFGDFWFREGVVHKVFRDPPPSMEPVEAVEDWFSAHFGPHMREWQVQSVDVDTDGDGVAERLAFVGDSVNSYGDVVPVFASAMPDASEPRSGSWSRLRTVRRKYCRSPITTRISSSVVTSRAGQVSPSWRRRA